MTKTIRTAEMDRVPSIKQTLAVAQDQPPGDTITSVGPLLWTRDPGHVYLLDHVEGAGQEKLVFMKRSSGAVQYDHEYSGLNTQTVLRCLIDRTEHLNALLPAKETEDALYHLRMALFNYEARAWRRKQQALNRQRPEHDSEFDRYEDVPFTEYLIEKLPVGPDGHIVVSTASTEVAIPEHVKELRALPKRLSYGENWETVQEFAETVRCGAYQSWDCDAYWACEHAGTKYRAMDRIADNTGVRPTWATHVYWYGK